MFNLKYQILYLHIIINNEKLLAHPNPEIRLGLESSCNTFLKVAL